MIGQKTTLQQIIANHGTVGEAVALCHKEHNMFALADDYIYHDLAHAIIGGDFSPQAEYVASIIELVLHRGPIHSNAAAYKLCGLPHPNTEGDMPTIDAVKKVMAARESSLGEAYYMEHRRFPGDHVANTLSDVQIASIYALAIQLDERIQADPNNPHEKALWELSPTQIAELPASVIVMPEIKDVFDNLKTAAGGSHVKALVERAAKPATTPQGQGK